jgi:hypothetical protein
MTKTKEEIMANLQRCAMCIAIYLISTSAAWGQTSVFTYQGKLNDGVSPANGSYDVQFKLFDTATVGTGAQQGVTIKNPSVVVSSGVFAVQLDFGSAVFSGPPRYLEIAVRAAGSPNAYTVLGPRSQVSSAPYSLRSLNSSVADTLSSACVGCVSGTQIGGGSSNYIQNTTSPQAASNFNISGTGTANIFSATTQFNIGSNRVLGIGNPGGNNLFAGIGAGQANTGTLNAFFGAGAGLSNTSASSNAFFGANSGISNTTGSNNAFFGSSSGNANTTGFENSFFGLNSGASNTTGSGNSFFGMLAGTFNNAGTSNAFFGQSAGQSNTSGVANTFVGKASGLVNTVGSNNTIVGSNADVGATNLTFATALGAGAVAAQSNSIYLGRANGSDAVRIPGSVVIDGSLVVGTLGSAGSTSVCLNASNRISPCSSSLRYKTFVQDFSRGLDVVRRLRPITFDWKEGGMHDIGFGAEEVNAVEPLLTTRNSTGEIEGVKYPQMTTILVNAIKEQQNEIEAQRERMEDQQRQIQAQQKLIDGLKQIICAQNPSTEICKEERK